MGLAWPLGSFRRKREHQVTVRWITDRLGTAAWTKTPSTSEYFRLDVRDLIDGPGNDVAKVSGKIARGVRELQSSKKPVVICCDWGASRSNAVAAGILSQADNIPVSEAFRRVVETTGEQDIKGAMYEVVRRALEPEPASRTTPSIAVLGANSLLGRRLAEYRDSDTHFFDRSSIDLLGDLTGGISQLGQAGVTDLVLLAQPERPFGRAMVGGTMAMTYAALEVAHAIGARLVMPSSIAVFGGAEDRAPLTPDYPRQPRDDFGFAKSAAEVLAESYATSRGIPLLIVRFPHLYGPRNLRPTVLANALERIRQDAPVTLRQFRNGLPELDLLTVEDGVRALHALVRTKRQGIVHVGTGQNTLIKDVVEMLISLMESKSAIRFEALDSDTRRHTLQDVEKDLLTPSGRVSLQAGLQQLLSLTDR
jgi:nucleoside-diphosphate-sugar epimerase